MAGFILGIIAGAIVALGVVIACTPTRKAPRPPPGDPGYTGLPQRRPDPPPAPPRITGEMYWCDRHSLTLEFGRVLSEAEFREIVVAAHELPYVQGLRAEFTPAADASDPHVDSTGNPSTRDKWVSPFPPREPDWKS
jgi:hypothetical protein